MIPLTLTDLQILIAASIFLLGCTCIILGAFVLISRGYSREVRTLAAHSARLGRKGMAEELTSLVNGASDLVASINQLVRTATGVGVFLVSLGMVFLVASYWVLQQIEWVII
ncbi:MAG: hypothetical protein PVI78_10190 [Anaerolineales bacterium]|jgi:hypothetical protein